MTSRADSAEALRFTRPTRQILLMLIICGLFAFGSVLIFPMVQPVFLANPYLNGTIAVVFLVGVLACFWQVLQLYSSVSWIESTASGLQGTQSNRVPQLLAPLAGVLRGRGARMQLSTASSRSVLDSVGARMEESRDITRYIANLLIFLGLLGTFFGLATTVPAVVETIRSLQPTEGEEGMAVFGRLMAGLEDQLGGMGTAFASSLLGLAGSLVVGLLELFAGHGQNRFYREMEEWLSTITRVGFSTGDGDGEGGGIDRAAVATVLDHMVDQIDSLESLFARSETRRAETEDRLISLAASVENLTERLGPGQVAATERLALAQDRLSEAMLSMQGDSGGMDDEAKMRLRSIDVQLLKIFEEIGAGRQQEISALRGDINELSSALRALTQAAATPEPNDAPAPRRAPKAKE